MAIERFRGGSDAVRTKLNQLVDAVNSLQAIAGDGIIAVNKTGQGYTIRLSVDRLLPRIPKPIAKSGMFPIKVVKDGGVGGSPTANCTFTYTVKDLAGATLKKNPAGANATGMTPLRPRYVNCEYDQPAADSFGLAFFDADSNLQLYEAVQEKPKGDVVQLQTQYQVANNKFQVKYRSVLVLEAAAESANWIDVHVGTECPPEP